MVEKRYVVASGGGYLIHDSGGTFQWDTDPLAQKVLRFETEDIARQYAQIIELAGFVARVIELRIGKIDNKTEAHDGSK